MKDETMISGARERMCAVAILAALAIAGTGYGAQPVVGKLPPEPTVLIGIDGKLVHADANDVWWFELTAEVKSDTYQVPAGTRFRLLPVATLERMIVDVNDRYTCEYRLTAQVTRYDGVNYLLATYFLPLSKFKSDEPEDGGHKTEVTTPILPADPELKIPPEIVDRLKNRRPVRGPLRKEWENPTGEPGDAHLGRMLVNRVGLIGTEVGQAPDAPIRAFTHPRFCFTPYALGWNVSDLRYELLPCKALESVRQAQCSSMEPIRFSVVGLVTRFQGRQYLLLQRATPVYNYGNFGR